ncbi:hypothetical protein CHS0354_001864 [Potamilus streckersoni]|uniref:Uncharacterized protein n=1 Tax=Potamilus streckersoni TaxID=2493646 RepID=A0AAE0TFG6_9BIVA|nr:hypothetical protein CHS0354_001864 [Potamilus streckersoni]
MTLEQYIYRVLAENEDPKQGLVARDPTAKIKVVQHILGQRKSQFISTTATLDAAKMFVGLVKKKFPKQNIRMVKIDVEKLMKEKDVAIIDLTNTKILETYLPENAKMARNWAIKYKEVLVKGKIPAHCVTLMESYEESSGFELDDYSTSSEESVSLLSDEMSKLKSK